MHHITINNSPPITGTHINYYFVCFRKLWLFSRGIRMEHESDVVFQGKLLGEDSYDRRQKEINIEDTIVLDHFDFKNSVIHEVKKSRAVEQEHLWQVRYYIYFLKQRGISATGELEYPLLKRKENVELDTRQETELEKMLSSIRNIMNVNEAPALKKKSFCRSCAYFEFCWE